MAEEKKKLNVRQVAMVSLASVVSMGVGSLAGIKGTYIGTGVGTAISGVLAFFFEKASLKARDDLRRKAKFFKPDDEDATSMFPAIKVKRSQRPWMLAAIGVGMALISGGITFGIFGLVKGTTGTTLGNYTPVRAPRIVRTVTETPVSTFTPESPESSPPFSSASYRPTLTPSPSLSPSRSPSPSSAAPSPSAIPDASPSPTSVTP